MSVDEIVGFTMAVLSVALLPVIPFVSQCRARRRRTLQRRYARYIASLAPVSTGY